MEIAWVEPTAADQIRSDAGKTETRTWQIEEEQENTFHVIIQ